MSDDYADAICRLEEEVDRACSRANEVLSSAEIATELRRLADRWSEQ